MMSKKNIGKHTGFLYARPSFLEGVGRIIDFGNILQKYNTSSTPELADKKAIQSDWLAVGNDMRQVLRNPDTKRKNK